MRCAFCNRSLPQIKGMKFCPFCGEKIIVHSELGEIPLELIEKAKAWNGNPSEFLRKELNLTQRYINALSRLIFLGRITLVDVVTRDREWLLNLRDFGLKGFEELDRARRLWPRQGKEE
jgi:hypothetical protein